MIFNHAAVLGAAIALSVIVTAWQLIAGVREAFAETRHIIQSTDTHPSCERGRNVKTMKSHPAKFTNVLLEELRRQLDELVPDGVVLDPFAGTGRIHSFSTERRWTRGIELEPEFALEEHGTRISDEIVQYGPRGVTYLADALELMEAWLPEFGGAFRSICTSPCYGNRMADKDLTESRSTYASSLGRLPSPGSSAILQWGPDYRAFHVRAWSLATALLSEGGWFILNVKDHYRNKERQKVAGWHLGVLTGICNLAVHDVVPIPTPGYRRGTNRELRVGAELVITLRKEQT